jgi:hypothetical protein
VYDVNPRRGVGFAAGLLAVFAAAFAPQARGNDSDGGRVNNWAPVVTITSPVNGAILKPLVPVTIKATATDPGGRIKRVRFYVDGVSIGRDESAPFEEIWFLPRLGTHVLTAVGKDDRGATSASAPVTVRVAIDAAPTVSLTSPLDGASYANGPAAVTLIANATDDFGVTRVDFFADSNLVGTRFSPDAPLGSSYSLSWTAAVGPHTLSAVATDTGGQHTTSASMGIAVNAPPPPAMPTASLTPPSTTIQSGQSVTLNWTTTNVTSATINGNAVALNGSQTYSPTMDTTYTLVATNSAGSATATATVTVTAPPQPPPGDPTTAPLVQQGNLVLEGAFRVPDGVDAPSNPNLTQFQADRASFSFGGTSLAFNPANNSLFMVGHDQAQLVAEVAIPALLPSPTIGGLSIASFVRRFGDVTDLKMQNVNPDPVGNPSASPKIGGLLPYGNKLYASDYLYYDGTGTQKLSHFTSDQNLALNGDAEGPFQVQRFDCDPLANTNCLGAGFFDGYFGMVPLEWQAAFGGPVLNGNCCLGVISRTSYGPSVFAVDPALLGTTLLGTTTPLPATPLVYYPTQHPLLEAGLTPCLTSACSPIRDGWSLTSTLFNGTTEIRGVVFPQGTRSVLFFGRHGGTGDSPSVPGGGKFCYGPGTADATLVGTPAPPDNVDNYCYDPEDGSKGVHGYPYKYYVWAYDANDLAKVSSVPPTADPWSVRPYAFWSLNFPFPTTGITRLGGAAYDATTGRIYLAQYQADGGALGTSNLPLIYVYKLQLP